MLGGEEYGAAVDNWGIGCIVSELLSGTPLIRGKNEPDQISKMFALLGPPSLELWPSLSGMPLVKIGAVEIPARHSGGDFGAAFLDVNLFYTHVEERQELSSFGPERVGVLVGGKEAGVVVDRGDSAGTEGLLGTTSRWTGADGGAWERFPRGRCAQNCQER